MAGISTITALVLLTSVAFAENHNNSTAVLAGSNGGQQSVVESESGEVAGQGWIPAEPLRGVGARTAALLQSGSTGGEIDGAMVWTSDGLEPGGDRFSFRFFVDLKGSDLLLNTSGESVQIDVHAYLLTSSGGMVGFSSSAFTVADPSTRERIKNTGLRFAGAMSAPPGDYSLRVLIQNQQSQRYFLHRGEVHFGGNKGSDPILLPPLVPDPAESWVIGLQHGLDADEVLSKNPAVTSWPSSVPMWRLGDPLEATLGSSDFGENAILAARLTAPDGSTVAELDIETGLSRSLSSNLTFVPVTIDAVDVPAGQYDLAISISDSDSKKLVSNSIPVLLHAQNDAIVWTDPGAPRRKVPAPPSPLPDRPSAVAETTVDEEEAIEQADTTPVGPRFLGGNPDSGQPVGVIEAVQLPGVGARGAALLMSGQSGGRVEGSVVWTSDGITGEDGKASISVFVEVDGRGLLKDSRFLPVPIAVYGYLVHSSGAVVGHLSEGILLNSQSQALAIDAAGLRFVGQLEADPGLYSFRIIILNRETNRFFLARRELDIRGDEEGAPLLLPPLVAEDAGSWVMSTMKGLDLEAVRQGLPEIGGWPAAMPVWPANQDLEMVIGSSQLGENRHLSARVFDRLGRLVGDPALHINTQYPADNGISFYRATAPSPDIPEGRYRLVIFATDADSGQSVSQSMTVLVHNQDRVFAWTDPAAPGREESQTTLGQPAEPTAEERDELAMRSAYLEALNMWSRGQAVEARRALAALEHPMEASVSARAWRRLITVERIATLEMGKSHPASLMAIALLHRGMYDWYLARNEPQLARHSWQIASMIARIIPEIEGLEVSLDFGECMLLDLSSRLVRSGEREAAQQLLEATRNMAPDSAAALLGLGALHERSGNTEAAVDEFSALYEEHPDHDEGQLRLAVNRARLGAEEAAEELYRDLLSETTPMWIRILAYQQLGSMLIDEGRVGEAFALLDEGVAQIPNNQRLHILLAHVLDASQRSRDAAAVIEDLGTNALQQSTSPRYRYSTWPDLDEGRIRETLAAASEASLPSLKEALQ